MCTPFLHNVTPLFGVTVSGVFIFFSKTLFLQVVRVGTMGRTVLSCAPVGKEGSAIQQLGNASVLLAGWDSPANKVTQTAVFVLYFGWTYSLYCETESVIQ